MASAAVTDDAVTVSNLSQRILSRCWSDLHRMSWFVPSFTCSTCNWTSMPLLRAIISSVPDIHFAAVSAAIAEVSLLSRQMKFILYTMYADRAHHNLQLTVFVQALILPFFNAIVGLIGAITFFPLTVICLTRWGCWKILCTNKAVQFDCSTALWESLEIAGGSMYQMFLPPMTMHRAYTDLLSKITSQVDCLSYRQQIWQWLGACEKDALESTVLCRSSCHARWTLWESRALDFPWDGQRWMLCACLP